MTAAEQVAALEEALVTTTNRESTALTAHDNSAIALQSTTGQNLEAQELAALNAKNAAGKQAAGVLRSAGIRFQLTRKQSNATLKAVERTLAKQGISTSELTALGSPSLKPAAANLLAEMGH
jgi:hypothetical protein